MPTTVRLARCAAKNGHSRREPTSPTAAKWVVVGLTRLRAEPENMDAGHTVCQHGSRQQIVGDLKLFESAAIHLLVTDRDGWWAAMRICQLLQRRRSL
jgi:hypothetical protein